MIFQRIQRQQYEGRNMICRPRLAASPHCITIWRMGFGHGIMPHMGYLMTIWPKDTDLESQRVLEQFVGTGNFLGTGNYDTPFDVLGKFYNFYHFNYSLDLVAKVLFKVSSIQRLAWLNKGQTIYWEKP